MKRTLTKTITGENTARNAWLALGGLVAVAVLVMTLREFPALHRELRILRM
jgi:tetrahydromethanopterin S-methyltransferase subunit E